MVHSGLAAAGVLWVVGEIRAEFFDPSDEWEGVLSCAGWPQGQQCSIPNQKPDPNVQDVPLGAHPKSTMLKLRWWSCYMLSSPTVCLLRLSSSPSLSSYVLVIFIITFFTICVWSDMFVPWQWSGKFHVCMDIFCFCVSLSVIEPWII